ncbi:hypothetical protein QFZ27_001866 [Inquilinus ginsengisoli]|uniref:nuclear transport factor 2 family protein n=1 Tax=Inquilinus ginsengisoli TaxID=363840 RepID=UPI003D1FFAC9
MTDATDIVKRYIACAGRLDVDGLADCFTADASLNGFLGPNEVTGTIELFFTDVKRMAAAGVDMSSYRGTIASCEATGEVARATVLMEGFAGAVFTDYLLLMRGSDGRWKIVAKAFTTNS